MAAAAASGRNTSRTCRSAACRARRAVYEWCAGPAFIGFSLLGHGLAETLCLADINPEAVEACRRTIADNRPGGPRRGLSLGQSEGHSGIGAVGSRGEQPAAFRRRIYRRPAGARSRTGASIEGFYAAVGKHLKPGGVIVHPGEQPRVHRRDVPRDDRTVGAENHLRRSWRAATHARTTRSTIIGVMRAGEHTAGLGHERTAGTGPQMNLARARVSFWRTIEHQHVKPALRRMRPYREAAYAGVRVSYKPHLDGGGSTFGQDFVPLLRRRGMPKVARAFEWCAGPGLHRLLAAGAGALRHALPRRRQPGSGRGLPAHASRATGSRRKSRSIFPTISRTFRPPSNGTWWSATRRISSTAASGSCAITIRTGACTAASSGRSRGTSSPAASWCCRRTMPARRRQPSAAMIAEAGLRLVFVQDASDTRTAQPHMYYLGIMRPGDPVPAWAQG